MKSSVSLVIAAVIGSCAVPSGAAAQGQFTQASLPCRVIESSMPLDPKVALTMQRKWISAQCSGSEIWLGAAVSQMSEYNLTLRALAVVLRDGGRSRVLLVSTSNSGALHVDDVSRELAKAAGWLPDEGLNTSLVDLSAFAVTGKVSVSSVTSVERLKRRGIAATTGVVATAPSNNLVLFDLTAYASARRARSD